MKKLILTIAATACVALGALGLTACVPKDLAAHHFADDWRHTIDEHWHYCTDTGCQLKKDLDYHDFEVLEDYVEKQPTCGSAGRGILRCKECGVTVLDAIPATGEHRWDPAKHQVLIEATCDMDGLAIDYCMDCHSIMTTVLDSSSAHHYVEGNWTATAAGHQQVCTDCGTPSGILLHEEDDPVVIQPSGVNDGKRTYSCKVCGYEMYSEDILNPNVPASLSVAISGADIEEREGVGYVALNIDQVYELTFSAVTHNGDEISNGSIVHAVEDSQNGIRAYLVTTGGTTLIDVATSQVNVMSNESGVKTIVGKETGAWQVDFWYETGDPTNPDVHRQRACYTLIVTVI